MGLTVSLSNGGGSYQDSILNESNVDAMVADNISDSLNIVRSELSDSSLIFRELIANKDSKNNQLLDSITVHRSQLNTLLSSDTSSTNEKITGFGIIGDFLYIKEGDLDTMKVSLKAIGENAVKSFAVKYSDKSGAQGLIEEGFTVSDLLTAGLSIADLLAGGITLAELLVGGATPCEVFTDENKSYLYGQSYAGGLIFYINSSCGGMVTSPSTIGGPAWWGCTNADIPGAMGSAVGTGRQNTLDIKAQCPTAGVAVDKCTTYRGGGHMDWFLPSTGELSLVYQNVRSKGFGSYTNYFWSSTQSPHTYYDNTDMTNYKREAYLVNLDNGSAGGTSSKERTFWNVLAVREF